MNCLEACRAALKYLETGENPAAGCVNAPMADVAVVEMLRAAIANDSTVGESSGEGMAVSVFLTRGGGPIDVEGVFSVVIRNGCLMLNSAKEGDDEIELIRAAFAENSWSYWICKDDAGVGII